ncbi:hypothetical protein NUU61_005210 [Penicillium alfredii]|uniref:RNA recognition motif-containing protein n=1 Tax=Penicillium alfredii TaxID=1506179 RepID=A0A9W9F9B9_9EURO|nr:uncharacterized protein NUU61_005210 [Penicillium alfredii]KAJ5095854.1 hypothetical protein NUU61_005210 [Penicillium alfredii]
MPPLAGEECLLTVFADLHYYFTAPMSKPLHHRFEKGSYLYIHHDAPRSKARIEIANNPGTADQDAFHGFLDSVHIQHSLEFPTRCTLTVDGQAPTQQQQQQQQPPASSQYEWRLPNEDSRTGQPQLLRLHTLDIYFWTSDDVNQFLDTVARVLSSSQLETDRVAAIPQSDPSMSTVVQQLENVAVSDPAYQNGQTRNSRTDSASIAAPVPQGIPQTFPPPPPSGPPADAHPSPGSQAEENKEPVNFTPLPYNPAAPAAPEPIQHREKTPPPEDGVEGTGLVAAAAADQGMPLTPPHQVGGGGVGVGFGPVAPTTQGLPYGGLPGTMATGYASPPPSAGLAHSNSFSTRSSLQSPGVASFGQTFLAGSGAQPQAAMAFAPPPKEPNAHLYAQPAAVSPQSPPHQTGAPPPAVGGYSNYSYDQTQPPRQPGSSEYNIHSQVYRPSEAEVNSHSQKYAQQAMKNPGQRHRKLENNAARMESGVNRFLKKLEKKL